MPIVGENIEKPLKRVTHAHLPRASDNSNFRVYCPVCHEGLLLVARNSEGALLCLDRCTLCAQTFWYTDEKIAGESLTAPVPATMEDCFPLLQGGLSEQDLDSLKTSCDPEKLAIRWHNDIGRQMRNRWGLWKDSPLHQHMKERFGLEHPDDMSHKILVEFAKSHAPASVWERLTEDSPF